LKRESDKIVLMKRARDPKSSVSAGVPRRNVVTNVGVYNYTETLKEKQVNFLHFAVVYSVTIGIFWVLCSLLKILLS